MSKEIEIFLTDLRRRAELISVIDIVDPASEVHTDIEKYLDACTDEQLLAIYSTRVPWFTARAYVTLMNRYLKDDE